jgi:hypothetical protein
LALDYKDEIEVCLINCEEALSMKKNRIYIDLREFEDFHEFHLKSSYHMNGSSSDQTTDERLMELYTEFLSFYHENYPDNLIILIGDRDDYGHIFAQRLLQPSASHTSLSPIGRLCVLRGGIDAINLESPSSLRKGQKNAKASDFT